MSRRASRGRDDLPIRAEINITSLVDVAFTLLVIFIITAPILTGGVQVELPQGPIDPLDPSVEKITISITADGRHFVGDREFTQEDLIESLPGLVEASGAEVILISGDAKTFYDYIFRLLGEAQELGVPAHLVGRNVLDQTRRTP